MTKVIFYKYSVYGNNFILIDEIPSGNRIPEFNKRLFSKLSLNKYYGIGGDNILFLQINSNDTLININSTHNYWKKHPTFNQNAEYVFRMFEPNGEEALCCGNGLMSIALHIHNYYNKTEAGIITEIPAQQPVIRRIKWVEGRQYEVNLGHPSTIPNGLINSSMLFSITDEINQIVLRTEFEQNLVELIGYLIYTGEPHLVFYETPENRHFFNILFEEETTNYVERSNHAIHQIGINLNNQTSIFPEGININFARIAKTMDNAIEYRCFERGILRETLACGTGALATASIAHELRLITDANIEIIPCRGRWEEPYKSAKILAIKEGTSSWRIIGTPQFNFNGSIEIEN